MTIRTASRSDLAAVSGLLATSGLAIEGLDDPGTETVVADHAGEVIGAAAVESRGGHGLLRSVVVDAAHRRRRLGGRLVAAAVGVARDRGLSDLWLLTDTAEGFFADHGWRTTTRADLPATLELSPEYAAHCSDSAAVMVRDLD